MGFSPAVRNLVLNIKNERREMLLDNDEDSVFVTLCG
jgi:hypothetical protein